MRTPKKLMHSYSFRDFAIVVAFDNARRVWTASAAAPAGGSVAVYAEHASFELVSARIRRLVNRHIDSMDPLLQLALLAQTLGIE